MSMVEKLREALKRLANSENYWHTSDEPGGPYTAWRGSGEPDEIAAEALTLLEGVEVVEGMAYPTDADCSCAWAGAWVVNRSCGHVDGRPAILLILKETNDE